MQCIDLTILSCLPTLRRIDWQAQQQILIRLQPIIVFTIKQRLFKFRQRSTSARCVLAAH